MAEVLGAAKAIAGAYRKSDFEDAESYVKHLSNALATFPAVTVHRCANARFGIVRESKWPPSVAEVVEWCEKDVSRLDAPILAAQKLRETRAERERQVSKMESCRISHEETERRQAFGRSLKDIYGEDWGLNVPYTRDSRRAGGIHTGAAADYLRANFPDRIGKANGE